uniref:Non-specific lipid-transfer protein n=1 Tax=Oryza barthii TaxID=65489 RepID=A0A0D3HHF8_9ORYZ
MTRLASIAARSMHAYGTMARAQLVLVAVVAALLLAAPHAAVAITCSGVRSLKAAASSTADRRTACNCLKNAARGIKGLNAGNAASIPSKCGVSVPYTISASIDCSRYSSHHL